MRHRSRQAYSAALLQGPSLTHSRAGDPAAGFTLLELLIVVAIISLLATIVLPSLFRAKDLAVRLSCQSNLHHMASVVGMYLTENNDTYPCASDPVSVDPYYWLWMGRGWRPFVEPYLGGNVGAESPSVLFCPADESEQYDGTSYAYSMSFYHSPEQINTMDSPSDTYSDPQSSMPQQSSDVAKPGRKILLGEWTSNHDPVQDDKGWWCWSGSRNFLLADGHVAELKADEIRPARDDLPDANLTENGIEGIDVRK